MGRHWRRLGRFVTLAVQISRIDSGIALALYTAHRRTLLMASFGWWIASTRPRVRASTDGCTAGFIHTKTHENQLAFLDRMDLQLAGHRDRLRILALFQINLCGTIELVGYRR